MLAGGDSDTYRKALENSNEPYLNVQVCTADGTVLEDDLPVVDGIITATLNSRVSRQMQILMPEYLYPYEPTDLLAPYGNFLRVWQGVTLGNNDVLKWPTFFGRIQRSEINEQNTLAMHCADRGQDVVDARFQQPRNANTLNFIDQEIRELISDGIDSPRFGAFESILIQVSPKTWQLDRAQACDEMAKTGGALWYPQASGEFTLRRFPWTVASDPVVTYYDGGASDKGTVTWSGPSRSREDVWNSLTVTGEPLDGSPPVYGFQQDDNPDSITYTGSFGLRHQQLRLLSPNSIAAAQNAAQLNLQRLTSTAQGWTWRIASVDAAVELGDTVGLKARGQSDIQIVSGMALPLLGGEATIVGRSRSLTPLEGVGL